MWSASLAAGLIWPVSALKEVELSELSGFRGLFSAFRLLSTLQEVTTLRLPDFGPSTRVAQAEESPWERVWSASIAVGSDRRPELFELFFLILFHPILQGL